MISFKIDADDQVSLVAYGDGWTDDELSYEENFDGMFKNIKIFKYVVEFKSVKMAKNSYEEITGGY